MAHDIIVIGSSAGGITALRHLLSALPPTLAASLFIVQHRFPTEADQLLDVLRSALRQDSRLSIRAAVEGQPIRHGHIIVAPADQHLLLDAGGVQVRHGPRENMSRPAVDPLFRSAALAFGPRVMGIILSGSLDDGSLGLLSVVGRGGMAVVQDPDEAYFPSMPRHAAQLNATALVLGVTAIAELIGRESAATPTSANAPVAGIAPLLPLEQQVAMAHGQRDFHAELKRAGEPTGLTCPECQGAIWRLPQHGADLYRCHIGHAYSEASFEAAQILAQERALGTALKTIEERLIIYRHLVERMHARDPDRTDPRYDDLLSTLSEDARQLRLMLRHRDHAGHPDPGGAGAPVHHPGPDSSHGPAEPAA